MLHHPTREYLYAGSRQRAERLCDYFAGCLLMPKMHVKRLHGQGLDVSQLARAFGVSLPAMRVRLTQLGLMEPTPRCSWPSDRTGRMYLRSPKRRMKVAA